MKIALFGDCIPLGTLSNWVLKDKRLICNTFRPEGGGYCIKNILSDQYEVENFAQGHNGISYLGCAKPKWAEIADFKISTVYKICNNDLSKYDIILIFLGGNDFIHGTVGNPEDDTPETLYGALNIIKKQLDSFNGHVIWVLPPYKYSKVKEFDEYLNILKKYTGDNYISFYDKFKPIIKDNIKILFPDNTHPSVDCAKIMVPYVAEKINKIIESFNEKV